MRFNGVVREVSSKGDNNALLVVECEGERHPRAIFSSVSHSFTIPNDVGVGAVYYVGREVEIEVTPK